MDNKPIQTWTPIVHADHTPDWDRIPFEVDCGRCGASLNQRTQPSCPRCALEFEWGEVLPIAELRCPSCQYQVYGLRDPRCPECGGAFEWQRVLDVARLPWQHLFEHRWRQNPLNSLARTVWLACVRLRRLWALYDLQDRPRLAPLFALVVLQWGLFFWGWPVVAQAADWWMNRLSAWTDSNLTFIYNLRTSYHFYPTMLCWHLLTFAAFQVFFQSKRRFRVRWYHLLRVYVHATLLASSGMALWCAAEMVLDSSLLFDNSLRSVLNGAQSLPYIVLQRGVFWLLVMITWLYLWIGFHDYLKMPRGWGLAGLSMVLGWALAQFAIGMYL